MDADTPSQQHVLMDTSENGPVTSESSEESKNDDPWITVKSRKSKWTPSKTPENTSMSTTTQETQHAQPTAAPVHRRLPPLPKDDYKVIFRPRETFTFARWQTDQIANSIKRASNQPIGTCTQTMIVRIEPQQNIAIASVPDRDYAIKLIEIKSLQLGEKEYAVTAYAATPDNSGKGVIQGITPGTSVRTLMEGLYAPGHAVLYARMLGTTHSALITFEGEEVPFVVYYMDGEKRCYLYRSAKQVCQLCRTVGHRADVCPQPDVNLCAKCGTANPAQDHECTPKCALCQGEHLTAARDCPERYRNQSKKTADQRESRPTIRQPQNSSRAGTRSKSRSRSRQRSTSRARHIAAQGQQKSANSQVSWSQHCFPSLTARDPNSADKNITIPTFIDELRKQLKEERETHARELKETREIYIREIEKIKERHTKEMKEAKDEIKAAKEEIAKLRASLAESQAVATTCKEHLATLSSESNSLPNTTPSSVEMFHQMETSLSQKLQQQLQLQEQRQMQQLQLFLHEKLQEQLLAFREQLADNLPVKEKKRKKPKANSSVEDLDRSMENAPLPHDGE